MTDPNHALQQIAAQSHERHGHRPGFDCVLSFIPFEALVRSLDAYPGSLFATAEEHVATVRTFLKDSDSRLVLIRTVLDGAATRGDDVGMLATKIQIRMRSSTARPLLYIGVTDIGLAVSLAIYDDFWTDAW